MEEGDVALLEQESALVRQNYELFEKYEKTSVHENLLQEKLHIENPVAFMKRTHVAASGVRYDVHEKQVHAWNAFFDQLRWFNVVQSVVTVLAGFFLHATGELYLRQVVVLATLAEMGQWAGHLYFPKPGRQLPHWNVFFPSWCSHRMLHCTLSACCIMLLLCCFFSPFFLLPCSVLLFFCCLLDLWRLLYLHYWLLALFSLSLDQHPSFSLIILSASLYFWAGFFKLVSPEFHKYTAPSVFAPLFRIVTNSSARLFFSYASVAGEALIGPLLLASFFLKPLFPSFLPLAVVPCWLCCVLSFSMHAYIVIMIGLRNGIRTFISWNCFCFAIVSLISCSDVSTLKSFSSSFSSLFFSSPMMIVTALVMNIPPLLHRHYFRSYPTLCHAYFVPQFSGPSFLLFPSRENHRIPLYDNAILVPQYYHGSRLHTYLTSRNVLANPTLLCRWLQIDDVSGVGILAGDWVDWTLRLGHDDPYNETFGAGPLSFWRCVKNALFPSGGEKVRCAVLKLEAGKANIQFLE